jgi:uncharacterized protein YegP (UPF0339 family)
VVDYWYRVLKEDETEWHWELCKANGEVVARGVAETRVKATAHAMETWLIWFDTQRSSKDDNIGGVDH